MPREVYFLVAEDKAWVSRGKRRVSSHKTPGRIMFTALACLTLFVCGVYLGLTSFKAPPNSNPKPSTDEGSHSLMAVANQQEGLDNESLVTPMEPDVGHQSVPVQKPAASLNDLIWPSTGEIKQEPGWYYSPHLEAWRYVFGVVISGDSGRDIYACLPGTVQIVDDDPVEGKSIQLSHGSGLVTKYSGIRVALNVQGDEVQKGDVIARLLGADLVFEITRNEEALNPRNYLSQSK